MATVVFAIAMVPACTTAIAREDFARRRNLWFAITATAFVANNFWIYIVVTGILLLLAVPRERNLLAMYFFLLFAVPPIGDDISGLGIVNYFFRIDYLRLLSLAVLLPAALVLRGRPDTVGFGKLLPDKFLAGFMILQFALIMNVSTFTNTLRVGAFYTFIDIFLPYYVGSRILKNLDGFRDAIMAFVVAALLVSVIAMFEFAYHWLLYSRVDKELGAPWLYGGYLTRGMTTVRAVASTGHSIALGYVIAVGMGLLLYLRPLIVNAAVWRLAMLAFCGGLIASLSRGPWVGAAIMFMLFVVLGPAPGKSMARFVLFALIGVPLIVISPFGKDIVEHLPFIGSVDAYSVSYRQRLLEISIEVIMQHPVFGAFDFFYSPAMQELKSGKEGFIDLVNTYLGVGLSSGLVGLSLFCSFFFAVAAGVFKRMRRLPDRDGELYLLGRTLFAVVLGIMVIIFTVSSITVIPAVYWTLTGMSVAYARMLAMHSAPVHAPVAAATAAPQSALRIAHQRSH